MSFSLRRNIIALYVVKVSEWMRLIMPIEVLFYQSNGMSLRDIFILQSIYSLSIVVLEIPSGYFADALGRKKSLMYGSFFGFLGYCVYSFSNGFYQFAAAEIILGIGHSLISGADSALLYDSLLASRKADKYSKYEGKVTSIGNFAEAIAGISGGLLAAISIRTPYFVQAFVAFSAIPACLFLSEPPIKKKVLHVSIKEVLKVVKFSLIDDKRLRWNIVLSAVTGASTLTMAWFAQPYFKQVNLPVSWFGISWTILNLSVGIWAMLAYRFEKKFGAIKLVIGFTGVLCISYFLLSQINALWGISILLIFYIARGLATPTLKDYINRVSSSEIRSTILSVRSFVIRILFAIVGPFFGWLGDVYSLNTALFSAGIIFSILSAITLYFSSEFLKNIEKK